MESCASPAAGNGCQRGQIVAELESDAVFLPAFSGGATERVHPDDAPLPGESRKGKIPPLGFRNRHGRHDDFIDLEAAFVRFEVGSGQSEVFGLLLLKRLKLVCAGASYKKRRLEMDTTSPPSINAALLHKPYSPPSGAFPVSTRDTV